MATVLHRQIESWLKQEPHNFFYNLLFAVSKRDVQLAQDMTDLYMERSTDFVKNFSVDREERIIQIYDRLLAKFSNYDKLIRSTLTHEFMVVDTKEDAWSIMDFISEKCNLPLIKSWVQDMRDQKPYSQPLIFMTKLPKGVSESILFRYQQAWQCITAYSFLLGEDLGEITEEDIQKEIDDRIKLQEKFNTSVEDYTNILEHVDWETVLGGIHDAALDEDDDRSYSLSDPDTSSDDDSAGEDEENDSAEEDKENDSAEEDDEEESDGEIELPPTNNN